MSNAKIACVAESLEEVLDQAAPGTGGTEVTLWPEHAKGDETLAANGIQPAAWHPERERAAYFVSELLRLADRRVSAAAAIEVLRTALRDRGGTTGNSTLFGRCMIGMANRADLCGLATSDSVCDYFRDLASMSPERRALLEASVVGVMLGSGMGG